MSYFKKKSNEITWWHYWLLEAMSFIIIFWVIYETLLVFNYNLYDSMIAYIKTILTH